MNWAGLTGATVQRMGVREVLDRDHSTTIARASELLRTDPNAYRRDAELQGAQFEAMERQEAAPTGMPPIDHYEIERRISQQHVDRFATMLREEPEKYWRSPELQQQHRDAIVDTIREAPAGELPGTGAGRSRTDAARTGKRRRGSSLNAWPQGLRVVRFRRNNSLTGPDSRCMQKG